MIKDEPSTTTRENVHYLAELNDTDEIGAETKAAIEAGLDDIGNRRTITLEEYRQKRGL